MKTILQLFYCFLAKPNYVKKKINVKLLSSDKIFPLDTIPETFTDMVTG